MMNEEQYIAMMREDMKENFTMSFRNRPSQISVPRALFDNPEIRATVNRCKMSVYFDVRQAVFAFH